MEKLTSDQLLFHLNELIWAVDESGQYEQSDKLREVREVIFNWEVMDKLD